MLFKSFCIVMVPTLWLLYALLLVSLTDVDGPTIALALLSLPLFSYMGIIVTDAGAVGWKDLRPFVMRLFPSTRRRLARLPEERKQLQDDLRGKLLPTLLRIFSSKHGANSPPPRCVF